MTTKINSTEGDDSSTVPYSPALNTPEVDSHVHLNKYDWRRLAQKLERERNMALAMNEQIVKSWTDPGRAPAYHRSCQQRLRDEWPTLSRAIEALVKENDQDHTS